jgi:hypothetical protein
MTIYGEFDAQFRKKPALWRMFLLGFSALVFSSVLVSLLVAGAIALLGKAHAGDAPAAFVLFAPPVVTGSVLLDAAMGTAAAFPWIAGGAALLLAILMMFFWPSEPTLASQLLGNALGASLITFGAMTLAIESILARRKTLAGAGDVAGELAVLAVAVIVAVVAERRTVAVLSNLVPMDAPARRVRLWLARLGIPFAVLAAAGVVSGSLSPGIASALFLLVTFFENLARRPHPLFVQLRDVQMAEAAATLPILAALLIAGSVWAFGALPFRPHRALVWKGGTAVRFAALPDAWKESGLGRPVAKESVIRIQWSRERGAAAPAETKR